MNFFTRHERVMLLAIILAVIPNYAQSDGDFEILQNANNTVTITGYKGSATDVVIPSVLYGIKVVGIGKRAFCCKSLTSVVLPNALISIDKEAFRNDDCRGTGNKLGEIVIPNTVTHIEPQAFEWSGVTKISFGNGVRSIGFGAFAGNKIKEVVLPSSLTSVENGTFRDNEIERISFGKMIKEIKARAFTRNKIEELALPVSIKTIETEAFAYNHIQSLTIPIGVTIGEGAFGYNQLRSVTIPNSVTVGSNIFKKNPLNTLAIPASLTIEGGYSFFGIDNKNKPFIDLPLTRITMPANKDNSFLVRTGFEESFINFYVNQNRVAKTYFKNGPVWTLTAPEPTEVIFTDNRNEMSYKTVNIGGKTWMAANLSYKPQTGKSGCYDNNPDNCKKYGGLYDWNTALNVCPEGWHLPSSQEWDELLKATGTVTEKLKAVGGWDKYDNGDDAFGFSALPGGHCDSDGNFDGVGGGGYWWTATKKQEESVYDRASAMAYTYIIAGYKVDSGYNYLNSGLSVRCVQDG
jgi:uncharacterized protein (TIGR02145 family)